MRKPTYNNNYNIYFWNLSEKEFKNSCFIFIVSYLINIFIFELSQNKSCSKQQLKMSQYQKLFTFHLALNNSKKIAQFHLCMVCVHEIYFIAYYKISNGSSHVNKICLKSYFYEILFITPGQKFFVYNGNT